MNIFIPSILLGLGGKCLLNWALVFLQRSHACRSFVGIFSVSLSVVDTATTLILTAIHFHSEGHLALLGVQLTRYHTCLLVQILGQVYGALQWPVVILAALDHFCTISLKPAVFGAKWTLPSLATGLLWLLATLHVFLLSDFRPVLEDVSHLQIHRCWVCHTPQLLQVATLLLLILAGAALHALCRTSSLEKPPVEDQSRNHSHRRSVVGQVLGIFLKTWAPLLIFLAVLPLFPVGMPSYLALNVAWLCFLNSFAIAVILCVAGPSWQVARGSAAGPADSFCEWRFKFSSAAEGIT